MPSFTSLAAGAGLLTSVLAQTTTSAAPTGRDPIFYTFAPDNTTIGQPLVLKYGPDNTELVTVVLLHGTAATALTVFSTLFSTTGGSFTWTPQAPAGSTYGLEIIGARATNNVNYGNPFTLVAATGTGTMSQTAMGYQPASTTTPAPTLTSSMSMTTSAVVVAPGPASVSMSMSGLITTAMTSPGSMTTMTSMPTFTPSSYVHANGTTVTTTVCGCMLDKPVPGAATSAPAISPTAVASMPVAAAPYSNGTMTTSVAGVAPMGTGAPAMNATSFTMITPVPSATQSGIMGQIGNGAGALSVSMVVVAAVAGVCALLV